MKKTSGIHIIFSLLFFFAGIFAFYSCSNFLSGNDFKDKLDSDINYANAPFYEIRVECGNNEGQILSSALLKKKVSDEFEIEFKPAEGYLLKEWKAYKRLADGSLQELSEEYITFTEENSYSFAAIYRAKVKFVKAETSIVIMPLCRQLPSVISYSPAASGGAAYANEAMVLNFNIPLENVTFALEENVFITYYGTSVTEYFYQPELSEDKSSLIIPVKFDKLLDFMTFVEKPYIDLVLSVKDSDFSDSELIFNFRYKNETENLAPEKQQLFLTREEIPFDSAELFTLPESIFTDKAIDVQGELSDTEYASLVMKNRSASEIYIYGNYYDKDSGLSYISITEADEEHIFTAADENVHFVKDKSGYSSFCVKYKLLSEDGLVTLNIKAGDACGNYTEAETFMLIKHTAPVINSSFLLYNYPKDNFPNTSNYIVDLETYSKNLKNIKIYKDDVFPETLTVYNGVKADSGSYSFTCSYTDKNGEEITEALLYDNDNAYYNLDLDVDSLEGLEVKILIEDDLELSFEKLFEFPSEPILSEAEDTGTYLKAKFESVNSEQGGAFVLINTYNEGETVKFNYSYYKSEIKLYPNHIYQLLPVLNGLIGMKTRDYTSEISIETYTETVDVESVELVKSEKTGYLDALITISESSLNFFDKIRVETTIKYQSEPNSSTTVRDFQTDTNPLVVSVSCYSLFYYGVDTNASITFNVYGIKNMVKSSVTTYNSSSLSADEFDNNPPRLSAKRTGPDAVTFTLTDNEEANSSCYFTIDEKYSFSMDEATGFEKTISLFCFDETSTVTYTAADKNGNSRTGRFYVLNTPSTAYSKLEANEDGSWNLITEELDSSLTPPGIYVYYDVFNAESGVWASEESIKKTRSQTNGVSGGLVYTLKKLSFPENIFLRLSTTYDSKWSPVKCFYTGQPGSGDYDLILPNGASNDSVALQSDAPLLARTLITKEPYSDCSRWSVEEWERKGRAAGEKVLSFSESEHSPKKYKIPLEEIEEGEAYIVIVHFADNSTEKSLPAVK